MYQKRNSIVEVLHDSTENIEIQKDESIASSIYKIVKDYSGESSEQIQTYNKTANHDVADSIALLLDSIGSPKSNTSFEGQLVLPVKTIGKSTDASSGESEYIFSAGPHVVKVTGATGKIFPIFYWYDRGEFWPNLVLVSDKLDTITCVSVSGPGIQSSPTQTMRLDPYTNTGLYFAHYDLHSSYSRYSGPYVGPIDNHDGLTVDYILPSYLGRFKSNTVGNNQIPIEWQINGTINLSTSFLMRFKYSDSDMEEEWHDPMMNGYAQGKGTVLLTSQSNEPDIVLDTDDTCYALMSSYNGQTLIVISYAPVKFQNDEDLGASYGYKVIYGKNVYYGTVPASNYNNILNFHETNLSVNGGPDWVLCWIKLYYLDILS